MITYYTEYVRVRLRLRIGRELLLIIAAARYVRNEDIKIHEFPEVAVA